MATLSINSDEIPLWKGGAGEFSVTTGRFNPGKPLEPANSQVFHAVFTTRRQHRIKLGDTRSVSLAVRSGTRAKIVPIWRDGTEEAESLVREYKLQRSLRGDNVLLALSIGSEANMRAAGSFRYAALAAGSKLEVGVDAGYVQIRSYPRQEKFHVMLRDFLNNLKLTSCISRPPDADEVVAFEYGGYLSFGINASAGYEIKGTKSFGIRDLKLSEHYRLGIVGEMDLTGKLAGRYSVEVRSGNEAGWVRLTVRRKHSTTMAFAADASVRASLKTDGLPPAGIEFLGAILGVNAKSWINLIDSFVDEKGRVESIENIQKRLDDLAGDFIEEWTDTAIDKLPGMAGEFRAKVKQVFASCRKVENYAISLFDRFSDPLVDKVQELVAYLDKLKKITSWDQLQGEIDPLLWDVIRQLTDGDPLSWALGRIDLGNGPVPSLDELKRRIENVQALIRHKAHEEIRRVIRLSKAKFQLDAFMSDLEQITSPDKLKNMTDKRLRSFISRLTGRPMQKLRHNRDMKWAFEIVRSVVRARDDFWRIFDEKLEEAGKQSFTFALHDAYRKARESDALIDVEIRLTKDNRPVAAGRRLMESAGRGDFRDILACYQPGIVRLHGGILTHRLTRLSAFKFNVVGWHHQSSYESMYRLILEAGQRIVPSENGHLTVFTTLEMETESKKNRDRGTRNAELMQANFLLRFLGETRGVIDGSKFDARDRRYAVEVIAGRSASYSLTFTDKSTDAGELKDYLAFAGVLGLDAAGATVEGLAPFLKRSKGGYGEIKAAYDVRFTSRGLETLFDSDFRAQDIRTILRQIVLANYYGKGNITEVAWLYCSDIVRQLWEANPIEFVNRRSILENAGELRITSPIKGLRPSSRISNTSLNRNMVSVLFGIERDTVRAFEALRKLLVSKRRVSLKQYEKRLMDFGSVLARFDRKDLGDNSIFAVFDGLIRLHSPDRKARASSLTFTSRQEGKKRRIVFAL